MLIGVGTRICRAASLTPRALDFALVVVGSLVAASGARALTEPPCVSMKKSGMEVSLFLLWLVVAKDFSPFENTYFIAV